MGGSSCSDSEADAAEEEMYIPEPDEYLEEPLMEIEEEAQQEHALLDETLLEQLQALPVSAPYPAHGEGIDFILVDIQLRQDKEHGSCVQLFGRAADGGSLCALIHGWYPYLYVPMPAGWIDTPANKDCLSLTLQEALGFALDKEQHLRRILHQFSRPIVRIDQVLATDIMGFDTSKEQQLFLKIQVISAMLVPPLRELLETKQLAVLPSGVPVLRPLEAPAKGTPTYNSNLDPILQFMVDRELSGCQWCRVPCTGSATVSRCRYEVSCHVDSLHLLSSEEQSELGPLRVLSFDLEAAGRRGVFPDPGIDPVIQISIHLFTSASASCPNPKQTAPILLSFKECAPIEGATVLSFAKEESLLLAFRDIVLTFDPDILTGYNICNFDMEYLTKRAQTLEIGEEFTLMTRARPNPSVHAQRKREQPHHGMLQKNENQSKGPEHMHVREVYFQSAQVCI